MPTVKSDLARLDGHELTAEELEEAPELTDEQLANAKANSVNVVVTDSDLWPIDAIVVQIDDDLAATGRLPRWSIDKPRMTGRSATPLLAVCHRLHAAGVDPATVVITRRGTMPCLMTTVGYGARVERRGFWLRPTPGAW